MFQSPDERGGYCDEIANHEYLPDYPEFQSPDERGGYCDFLMLIASPLPIPSGFNPLTSGAGTATMKIKIFHPDLLKQVSIP